MSESETEQEAEPRTKGEPPKPQPPTRDEALNGLAGAAAERGSLRAEQIVAEAIAGGVGNINLFTGDFSVAGGFAAGSGGRPSGGRQAPRTSIDPSVFTHEYDRYVKPADFETGWRKLDLHHLVIYADPSGTGRDARATATMVEVLRHNGFGPAYIELAATTLGNPAWRPSRSRCAYVVRDRPNAQGRCAAESVTEQWLTYAAAQAREHESYLVVVTGPVRGDLATAVNRAEFVLTDLDLADPGEIVRRHVSTELAWLDETEVDTLLVDARVAELVEERDTPHFASRVAKAVAEAVRAGTDVAAALARLRDPEERVREWLGADPDLTDVALVLATAALEGCGYLAVADAAVALYHKLGGSGAALRPRYLSSLVAERSWIEVVETEDATRAVRFRHSGLRAAVLALTWFELDGARAKILDWLGELAERDDVEIRTRAASTAGLLAARDFEHGLHTFFQPWARDRSATLRQSAATGLNVAGRTSGRSSAFWRHIERWAGQGSEADDALPTTAALAAGGPLGVAEPDRALRVLGALADRDGWSLLEPVAVSTHLLIAAGQAGRVVDALLDWTESTADEERLVRVLSVFAFAANGTAGASAGGRPALLDSAGELGDTLPELWGRALDRPPVRGLAADALRTWVLVADTDPAVREGVLDVLVGIAERGDQDYERVCRLLVQWAADPHAPSWCAARFHEELTEEGQLVP